MGFTSAESLRIIPLILFSPPFSRSLYFCSIFRDLPTQDSRSLLLLTSSYPLEFLLISNLRQFQIINFMTKLKNSNFSINNFFKKGSFGFNFLLKLTHQSHSNFKLLASLIFTTLPTLRL